MRKRNCISMEIYDVGFEISDYQQKISEFCKDSMLGENVERDLELALEELVKKNIAEFIEHNNDNGLPISICIEHYGIADETEMTISYGGERYDPIYDGDELSAVVIKKLSAGIKYNYSDENRIVLRFTGNRPA